MFSKWARVFSVWLQIMVYYEYSSICWESQLIVIPLLTSNCFQLHSWNLAIKQGCADVFRAYIGFVGVDEFCKTILGPLGISGTSYFRSVNRDPSFLVYKFPVARKVKQLQPLVLKPGRQWPSRDDLSLKWYTLNVFNVGHIMNCYYI